MVAWNYQTGCPLLLLSCRRLHTEGSDYLPSSKATIPRDELGCFSARRHKTILGYCNCVLVFYDSTTQTK